ITASSLGRFLRGVAIPSDFGSIFTTAVDMPRVYHRWNGEHPLRFYGFLTDLGISWHRRGPVLPWFSPPRGSPRRVVSNHPSYGKTLSPGMLDRSARQAEIGSGGQHVAVAGPHLAFSGLVRGRQVHSVGSADEEIRGSGDDQGA